MTMPTIRTVRSPLNLSNLMTRFDTEIKCREFLESLRWPDGAPCPKCESKEIARVKGREAVLRCTKCQTQFTVTAGTVFNDSHLPLSKWFVATFILTQSKKGVSACQIQRMLGIGSYKTAWYLCHRIRSAMIQVNRPKLTGTVEMDETYVGGKRKGGFVGRPGRGTNKEVVLVLRQRGGEMRFFHAEDVKAGTLAKYMRENISNDVEALVTDDFSSYPFAMDRAGIDRDKHQVFNHSSGRYVTGDAGEIHTNTAESAFSLLKRGIIGTWHKLSAKHLASYLSEMEFRFNRRKSETLFQDTLRYMVKAPVLTFDALTGKEEAA
jgi:transposase-like protein